MLIFVICLGTVWMLIHTCWYSTWLTYGDSLFHGIHLQIGYCCHLWGPTTHSPTLLMESVVDVWVSSLVDFRLRGCREEVYVTMVLWGRGGFCCCMVSLSLSKSLHCWIVMSVYSQAKIREAAVRQLMELGSTLPSSNEAAEVFWLGWGQVLN